MPQPATDQAPPPRGGFRRALKIALTVLSVLFVVAYPLAVWVGLSYFSVRHAAMLLLALLLPTAAVKIVQHWHQARQFAGLALSAAFLIGLAMIFNDARFMMVYPVIVSAVMLSQFAWTLWHTPPLVERFARMQTSVLNAAEIIYCRRVTQIWCVFFILNGAVCAVLASAADRRLWALYTGLISYLIMAAIFTVEFIVRKYTFRHHPPSNPLDALADKIFPPGEEDAAARRAELAARESERGKSSGREEDTAGSTEADTAAAADASESSPAASKNQREC